jgi:tRNA 2-thiouridine synthesizing protein A
MTREGSKVERWDAGEMGCGALIFELHLKVQRLAPGETIEVVARGEGAPIELPTWCRTTGHELVSAEHPKYVIRRKPD